MLTEDKTTLTERAEKKWEKLLDHEDFAPIKDPIRRRTTALILENTIEAIKADNENVTFGISNNSRLLNEVAPTTQTGGIDKYDPVLISLVRRSMPNLIAYDVCGVQPMTGPTGLVFSLRPKYATQDGADAFYTESDTGFSGVTAGNTTLGQAANNVGTTPTGNTETYNFGGGMDTLQAEALGSTSNVAFAEMSFAIDKTQVEAKTRALKGEYSIEVAQDLKAIHGLDAETELSNILSAEALAGINREIIRTIYITAKAGANSTATPGTFDLDVDSNGRWMVEKFKGLLFQIQTEANRIAKDTRRGKGNFIICSSNVAVALEMAGVLDFAPAVEKMTQLEIDDTGNTFAGIALGRIRVYVDPYANVDFCVMGYRGASSFDAGLFYCPYVPLQLMRAQDPNSFQPKIGFKTRYGVTPNPFAYGASAANNSILQNSNVYYRRFLVSNLSLT